MNRWYRSVGIVLGLLAPAWVTAAAEPAPAPPAPRVFAVDAAGLAHVKARIAARDAAFMPAWEHLRQDADRALHTPPVSVMDKELVGDSGDKHDYFSIGRYWWPNPATKSGLPYVRRDGHPNEEAIRKGDGPLIGRMIGNVSTLALAYRLGGDEHYAEHAATQLRVWFLDAATRMNPNFAGAQAVPGVSTGRGTGLIEFAGFYELVDALGMLHGALAWTAQDEAGMAAWMKAYRGWMEKSPQARDERAAKNNHGCWFDTEEVSLLLYLGEDAQAKAICEAFKEKRIAPQIEPDGRQPLEIARADGLSYSIFNLQAMAVAANLARHVQVDLWRFQSPDGRGMQVALDHVLPYVSGEKPWPGQQLKKIPPETLQALVLQAEAVYGGAKYRDYLKALPAEKVAADREQILVAAQGGEGRGGG